MIQPRKTAMPVFDISAEVEPSPVVEGMQHGRAVEHELEVGRDHAAAVELEPRGRPAPSAVLAVGEAEVAPEARVPPPKMNPSGSRPVGGGGGWPE
jgi:hypothetical protein